MADLLNQPGGTPDEDEFLESTVTSEEPDVAKSPQVDSTQLDELKMEFERSRIAAETRAKQLEDMLISIANRNQTMQPAVEDEDIDLDDPAALYKISERMVKNEVGDVSRKTDAALKRIQEREFNQVRKQLDSENPEVVKRFRKELDQYYVDNPHERYNPDSYEVVMKYYKGELYQNTRGI